ncbi:MAG: T9SS type A sorting domain-containing protein [Ignavibacteriae bacterium]|nr:T9SS type A sorting domain-containing protein [Ignavibacteriota bacterium]
MRVEKLFAFFILLLCFSSEQVFSQLTRQWVARFSGGAKNKDNVATAMTLDDSGNVYVAGWVTRLSTGVDVGVVKYSPDGEKVWEAFHSESTNEDKAYAMAVDSARNVYVTGSTRTSNGLDYLTVKFNSDGSSGWAKTYNGPGDADDKAVAIAVNDSMNVYVTGWSMGFGTGFDFATIKYDSDGVEQWEKRLNGPGNGTDSALGLALRGFSDLFIVGTSVDTSYDYTTIKYNAATGDSLWLARYKGPGNDIARAIVLRGSTEVYVTGSSQTDTSGYDYLTIRYDAADGNADWVLRYDGEANGDDNAYALALNANSQLYVTGTSLQIGSFNDVVTLRYNQDGTGQVKVVSYNGTANDDDGGVKVTGGSKPYVLATSAGAGIGKDFAVIRYKANFTEEFDLRYNGPANSDDIPYAIVAADDKEIYVAGSSKSKAKGSEFLTIKYVDPKNLKYRTFIQDSLAGKGAKLKTSNPNIANVRDTAFARAYPKIKKGFPGAPGGLVLGSARPDSAKSYGWIRFTKGKSLAAFVPGTGTASNFDEFDGAPFIGEKKNPKREKHDNHLAGELVALRINIGASDAEVTPPTFGDLTYDLEDTVNGIPMKGKSIREIAALADNFLTYGHKYPQPVDYAGFDSLLSKINHAFLGPFKIVSKEPLVVTGVVHIDSVPFLKPGAIPLANPLAFDPNAIEVTGIPVQYELYQNYPNPFNPSTTIEFDVPEPSIVTLKIYDMLGREVATLVEQEEVDEGRQEVSFDASSLASGVYVYRILINQGEYQQIKKMVLIK